MVIGVCRDGCTEMGIRVHREGCTEMGIGCAEMGAPRWALGCTGMEDQSTQSQEIWVPHSQSIGVHKAQELGCKALPSNPGDADMET